jgi:hypothetical protein
LATERFASRAVIETHECFPDASARFLCDPGQKVMVEEDMITLHVMLAHRKKTGGNTNLFSKGERPGKAATAIRTAFHRPSQCAENQVAIETFK